MAGRSVFLDIARCKNTTFLEDGHAITNADLDAAMASHSDEVKRGDFVIIRTGQMEHRLNSNDWGGYAGRRCSRPSIRDL